MGTTWSPRVTPSPPVARTPSSGDPRVTPGQPPRPPRPPRCSPLSPPPAPAGARGGAPGDLPGVPGARGWSCGRGRCPPGGDTPPTHGTMGLGPYPNIPKYQCYPQHHSIVGNTSVTCPVSATLFLLECVQRNLLEYSSNDVHGCS